MVSISKLINQGLLLVGQSPYQDLASPQQASVEQYNIINFLGGSAPYLQHPGFGISSEIPQQCTLNQAHLLSRHDSRYPSKSLGKKFEAIYTKFQNYNNSFSGDLTFLNNYDYFVHNKNYYEKETSPKNSDSIYAGTTSALKHGTTFRTRYDEIFKPNQTLLIFTSNSGRVHQTSKYFARGFLGDDYSDELVHYSIIDEDGSQGANSLTPRDGCTNYDDGANDDKVDKYDKSYLQTILTRFQNSNSGLNITTDDVEQLFQWCAFEINVNGSSPFCNLFSNEEFIKSSYAIDLENYYSHGAGNNLTATIGSPFLNATLKLLKDEKSDNKIWLSFTHDTDIEIYHSTLNLLQPENDLPTDKIPFPNPYIHSHIVPQGARIYTEKYTCANETFVRFLVNDAVYPIQSCQDGPGFSCSLSNFENYVNDRIGNLDYKTQCGSGDEPSEVTFFWDYKTANYTAADIDS